MQQRHNHPLTATEGAVETGEDVEGAGEEHKFKVWSLKFNVLLGAKLHFIDGMAKSNPRKMLKIG